MPKKQILTKAELLKPKTRQIPLDDGSFVVIRALSASYAFALREKSKDGKELGSADIFDLISKSLAEPELTVEEVGQLSAPDLKVISEAIGKMNGMDEKAIKEAQEELKNASTEGSTTS